MYAFPLTSCFSSWHPYVTLGSIEGMNLNFLFIGKMKSKPILSPLSQALQVVLRCLWVRIRSNNSVNAQEQRQKRCLSVLKRNQCYYKLSCGLPVVSRYLLLLNPHYLGRLKMQRKNCSRLKLFRHDDRDSAIIDSSTVDASKVMLLNEDCMQTGHTFRRMACS